MTTRIAKSGHSHGGRLPRLRSVFFYTVIGILAVIIALAAVDVAAACPTCKEGTSDGNSHGVQEGYYWSILFMMSMPFAILGGFGLLAYLSIRRARRQLMEQSPFDPLPLT